MDTLGIIKRIEQRIIEHGMSKAEFYEKSGISSASFCQWKSGKYIPSKKKLNAAASVLGVSLDWLYGQTDDRIDIENEAPSKDETGSIKRAILQAMDGMTNDQLEKLLALIQSLRT